MNSKLQQSCDFKDHTKNHLQSYLPKADHNKPTSSKFPIMPGLLRLNSVGEDLPVSHIQKNEINKTGLASFGSIFQHRSHPSPLKKSLTSPVMNLSPLPEKLISYCGQQKNLVKQLDTSSDHNFKNYQQNSLRGSIIVNRTFHSFSAPEFSSNIFPFSKITKLLQPEPNMITEKIQSLYQSPISCPVYHNLAECLSSPASKSNTETAAQEITNISGRSSDSSSKTSEVVDNNTSDSSSHLHCNHSISDIRSKSSRSQENSNCIASSMDQHSVLLTQRKVVKKGRPSSKKQRKRQRQKQKHLVNSSAKESVTKSVDTNPDTNSKCKSSTPVKCESKSSEQPCVLFTLLSDSDLSESEDGDSDWSFCDVPISPIKDNAFNVALSLDAIFKQKNIPSLESVFSSANESSSDSDISFLSVSDISSCEQLVNGEAMKEINAKWERCYPSAGFRSCISLCKEKIENPRIKVHFAAEPELLTVHLVGTEDRCGTWQHYALDRDRFERRIQEVGQVISPVLEQQHRAKILERNRKLTSCVL